MEDNSHARRERSNRVTNAQCIRISGCRIRVPLWKLRSRCCMLCCGEIRKRPACVPIASGEMAEWLKAHAWKACIGETLSRVRIPLSPPFLFNDFVRFSPRNPDYACSNCGWRCWIGEEGYAFGHDTHEVNCKNCGIHVANHDTTSYVSESWKPPVVVTQP